MSNPNSHHPPIVESDGQPAAPVQPDPLRSVHTSNLPGLLEQLGISLAVSTYQAGKVILVRSDRHIHLCMEDRKVLDRHLSSIDRQIG